MDRHIRCIVSCIGLLITGLDWRKTLKIIKGIASAIQKLHEFKPALVHRDLKLDNILLDKNFTPKLADFGKVTPEGEHIISGNFFLQLIRFITNYFMKKNPKNKLTILFIMYL
uniref:Protein kinase domain-containing protein n=1 Tax=Manihot esculenta TaxID=3983 RepID=A0A2C9V4T5_MANES